MLLLTVSGEIIALTPITTSRLKILDPTTFPIAISLLPLIAAERLTASSGALVPNATIVSPITIVGMCIRFAIDEAPSTKKSAPFTSSTNPTIKYKTGMIIICILHSRPYFFKISATNTKSLSPVFFNPCPSPSLQKNTSPSFAGISSPLSTYTPFPERI